MNIQNVFNRSKILYKEAFTLVGVQTCQQIVRQEIRTTSKGRLTWEESRQERCRPDPDEACALSVVTVWVKVRL